VRARFGHLTRLLCGIGAAGAAAILAGAAAPTSVGVVGGAADVLDVVQVTGSSSAASPVAIVPLLGVGIGMGTTGAAIPLPTAASGSNVPFTESASASSEGALSLSANGKYLTLAGYDATPGTAGVASSTTIPRVLARVDGAGHADTSTVLPLGAFSGNNIRGATSNDGTQFWATGAGGNPRGIVYAPLGNGAAAVAVASNVTNARVPVIANGQLYLSTNNNTPPGLYKVGTGLPTTATPATALVAATGNDPYGFVFTDANTLYVADGGIKKYFFNGSAWVAEGSAAAGTQLAGLAGKLEGGVVQLYATALDGSKVFAFTDTAASNATISGSFSVLATPAGGTLFKGIAFAPSDQVPPAPAPTVQLSDSALGGVIGDAGNPTLTATVHDDTVSDDQIQVQATSSNQAVAADGGITVTGSGAARTIAIVPAGAVGYATITVAVTAPGAPTTTVQFQYGASAPAPDGTSHFLDGASDASTAVDVGDGYVVVGDDESNILRLYNTQASGGPVRTWDFTGTIGGGSIDIEASARWGDTIYWTGSMGNNSDGSIKPQRSTLFATQISGSGASTQLTLVGQYKNLRSDLIAWDQANGDPLGFAAGAADGQIPKEIDGFNVEGMEFASDGTAYIGFRAPLLPQTDRQLALVVPVTNLQSLVTGGGPALFGAPLFWNLNGSAIRELRRNASGQYLVLAGSYEEGGQGSLYSWDGNVAHQPALLTTTLPTFLTGAWEGIANMPDPLNDATSVQLLQDDGDWDFYGDGNEAKALALGLRKAVIDTFTIGLPAPPTVGSVSDVTAEATGPDGAAVTYSTPGASDPIDPNPVVACLPASGSTFPLGPTTVSCTASDVQGRTSAPVTFTVNVQDTTPPTLSGVPGDLSAEATSASGAAVSWTDPTATDLVDPHPTTSCVAASGSTFPLGTTTVSCTAHDAAGNTSAAQTFHVTVSDTTPPTLSNLPANQTAEATGPSGAAVSWTAPTATDLVDPAPTTACVPASGSTFALGTTTVSCTARDATGNTSAAQTFTVAVRDTTAPSIAAVSPIVADAVSPAGASVSYTTPVATDLVDGTDPVVCLPASGSVFPIGVTTVGCSATDAHGNPATSSFTVTVHATDLSDLRGLLATANGLGGSGSDGARAKNVQRDLNDAQQAGNWIDGNTLVPSRGLAVLDDLKDAAIQIDNALKDKKSALPQSTLQAMLALLEQDSTAIAQAAVQKAQASGTPSGAAAAASELAQGKSALAGGNVASGFSHLENAWDDAEVALGAL
jgi:hypothetical protein